MGTNFGSTRRLKSGRFQARYTGPDGQRYKAPSTFPDELAALGWLSEIRKSIDLGTWETPSDIPTSTIPTVGEIVQHWLDMTKPQVRSTTFKAYQEVVSARVLGNDKLCRIAVDRLSPALVARWWQDTTKAFPDTAYRNARAYQKLRAAMELAVDYGYIVSNPVHLRSAARLPKSKVKELPCTEDLREVLAHVPHRYRFITVLVLFHGLRIGEALAVKGDDISVSGISEASVRVKGTLARVPNGAGGMMMELHAPKTMAGYRTVPILREFVPVVLDHVTTYGTGPDELATKTNNGSPVFDTSYRSVFNRAKAKAGITSALTPHYGRNYLITRLAEAGATPKEIGRILGQEDVSTIVNTYMRARETRSSVLMSRVNLDD